MLMKMLYAARMARFDLLKATNSLARKLTKWDKKCDLQLRRLVAYIWSSLDKRLVGYVSKDDKQSGYTCIPTLISADALTLSVPPPVYSCV